MPSAWPADFLDRETGGPGCAAADLRLRAGAAVPPEGAFGPELGPPSPRAPEAPEGEKSEKPGKALVFQSQPGSFCFFLNRERRFG